MIACEMLFSLLCVCRRHPAAPLRRLRQALRQRGLYYASLEELPRLDFWVKLAQAAGVLDEARQPTLLAPDWLAMPPVEQLHSLFEAWLNAAESAATRRARQRLPERLLNGPASGQALGQKEWAELSGLQALGLYQEGAPTRLGLALWGEDAEALAAIGLPPAQPWLLRGERLLVPYPPAWNRLWGLEMYLDPYSPGQYALTPAALRLAVQRAAPQGLECLIITTAVSSNSLTVSSAASASMMLL